MRPTTPLARAALFLLLCGFAVAAPFTLRSEVDAPRIGVHDQVQLTITVEGSGAPDEIALPALTNLEVVSGPFQSTQVSIIGGSMTQSRTWTYVLQPRAAGKAEVGAVSAGGETAPAIAIEVVAGSVRPREPRRAPDPFRDPFATDPFEEFLGRRRGRAPEGKLLIEAAPSRTRLRVGEPLVLTYNLYTQVSVTDLQFVDAPQYPGFWVEDLQRPADSPSGQPATVEGEPYRRLAILQKLLFPTRAGTLTIPAATMKIGIPRLGFFDSGGVVRRSTKPVEVKVEPLPDQPGFSGAVGSYRTSATLDRDVVALGEAATLRFKVEGTGNLKWIDRAPEVAVEGARVYPPQAKSSLEATPGGISGSRTWEFVLVPETAGALAVPPLAFRYFDPTAGRIETAQTAPLTLRVEAGTASAAVPLPPPSGTTARATGILPLRADLDPHRLAVPILGGRVIALAAGLALVLHVGLLAGGRLHGGPWPRGTRTASPRSVRAALRDLGRVGAETMSKEAASALVEKALHEAFGELEEKDETERARAVRTLLEEVRFVRYAPQLGDYSEKIRALAERAAEAVRRWA